MFSNPHQRYDFTIHNSPGVNANKLKKPLQNKDNQNLKMEHALMYKILLRTPEEHRQTKFVRGCCLSWTL